MVLKSEALLGMVTPFGGEGKSSCQEVTKGRRDSEA